MPALLSLSAPGWTQSTIAVVAILFQLNSLYDPSSFMTAYEITSIPVARLNAFYLICIDTIWLLGVFQENKALYWVSIIVRGANAALFWSFGGKWKALAGAAATTMTLMLAAMMFDRRNRGAGKGWKH